MEAFSALLALCAGNSPVSDEFPAQRPVTRSFDVFFDLRLIKRLRKHSRGWWFETLSRPLWRHCNETATLGFIIIFYHYFYYFQYIIHGDPFSYALFKPQCPVRTWEYHKMHAYIVYNKSMWTTQNLILVVTISIHVLEYALKVHQNKVWAVQGI